MGSIQEGEVSSIFLTRTMAIEESKIGRNIVSVMGSDAATSAKASALSLQSLGTCSNFHAEKLARNCLIKVTYFTIRGSQDSYSEFTCPTTNWESLRIISLSDDIAASNSISAMMASYSNSLLEALKPSFIACSILSPLGNFNCRPMSAPGCRDAPSTLRVHQFELSGHVSGWGISTRKSTRTYPFLANLGLYRIPYSLSSIDQRAILPDKSDL